MPTDSPFIVAELSANHLGDEERAHKLIEAAHAAGADAVKFQTWSSDRMCLVDHQLAHGPWAGRSLQLLYREAWTPWEWHTRLFTHAKVLGMVAFSAAFDRESVDFLETLNVDRHKVASFELVDLPLIRYMASTGKPMILSTGTAAVEEIDAAVGAATAYPTLLVCTSAYPADASEANLVTMAAMLTRWNCYVGASDHSIGVGVAVAAAALGATYIEKHLTLSRADGGPDAGFSLEPAEFKQLVTECRRAAAAIGEVRYGPGPSESTALRRSLWVLNDIEKGEALRLGDNVVTARPALGLSPGTPLEGKRAARWLKARTPLTPEDIA